MHGKETEAREVNDDGAEDTASVTRNSRWLVLRVPGRDGRIVRFDGHTFSTTTARSPVQWHRHGNHCSVRQRGRAESPRAHYYCELDDLVLAKSSLDLGVDVFTNDLGLRRAIVSGRGRETRGAPLHEPGDAGGDHKGMGRAHCF